MAVPKKSFPSAEDATEGQPPELTKADDQLAPIFVEVPIGPLIPPITHFVPSADVRQTLTTFGGGGFEIQDPPKFVET